MANTFACNYKVYEACPRMILLATTTKKREAMQQRWYGVYCEFLL
jgi:hypothetical protein